MIRDRRDKRNIFISASGILGLSILRLVVWHLKTPQNYKPPTIYHGCKPKCQLKLKKLKSSKAYYAVHFHFPGEEIQSAS